MAKWRGTATVVYYFEAPDKRSAQRRFGKDLDAVLDVGYRDAEVEEVEEKEWERETNDGD